MSVGKKTHYPVCRSYSEMVDKNLFRIILLHRFWISWSELQHEHPKWVFLMSSHVICLLILTLHYKWGYINRNKRNEQIEKKTGMSCSLWLHIQTFPFSVLSIASGFLLRALKEKSECPWGHICWFL